MGRFFLISQDNFFIPDDSLMFFTLHHKNFEDPDTIVPLWNDPGESDEDLYLIWDTVHAHPYDFEKLFTYDSLTLELTGNAGDFVIPHPGKITSHFGWRRRRPHYGTDIDLEKGDTVRCAFNGIVRMAKYYHGYGNCVIIRHPNGLETVYAHLSKIEVKPNEEVQAGQTIGLGGNTGRSFGAHLHWEIRFLGKAIDAEDIVDFDKGKLKSNILVVHKSDFENKYDLRALRSRHRKDVGMHGYIQQHHSSPESVKFHKIRKGDTLGKLAKKYRTSIKEICRKNKISPKTILKEGRILKI
ncbi:MAG: M23 family metallopeptidase [Bacteroidia bacterium]|nr:M23 family metallopeptidase [Bacteroidia bacterium]